MNVGAITYQPYVYNANAVSSNSLNKISGIGEDLLASKTDFSGITEDRQQQNQNLLKLSETKNFTDILMSQMQMGRMNAARVMTPTAPEQDNSSQTGTLTADAVSSAQNTQEASYNAARMQQASNAYMANMIA